MRFFSLQALPPRNELAIDESLMTVVEKHKTSVFRVWELARPCVVLGRGSKFAKEVRQSLCEADDVEILRRTSGGATILAGPGCLMYTLVLCHEDDARLNSIDATHQFVLGKITSALNEQLDSGRGKVVIAGTSDLAWQPVSDDAKTIRKFSGNSMRRGRTCTLYHGTILYDFDLDSIGRYLQTAPRQPEYRAARDHGEFVMNLPLDRQSIIDALHEAWEPGQAEPPPAGLLAEVDELVETKYSLDSWNLRH